MRYRCFCPNNPAYKDYGGRGITVCKEWVDSFAVFIEYVGRRPSPKYSLDRYPNNNGNYEPGNVRWATSEQQAANTRTGRSKRRIANGKRTAIGMRLRSRRKSLNLTLRNLEAKSGVSNAFICQLETGHAATAAIETVVALSKALKCDPAWLAFGAGV